ncbi:hypothetical protein S7711_01956 [Stachybotrys chartarum IBT 7711]|uniref:Tetratricopeptide repeat protein 1 n=1 Tax=Stachybotrys chartarum (strain CBS 109288 / IBT 7711) TaxID=1280523 RepID=A0A084AMY6_STACB|nr:hypothetical protein S7711_01956 [Stachybotrys chartarum IBT 7711]
MPGTDKGSKDEVPKRQNNNGDAEDKGDEVQDQEDMRFSPEEEASLLQESNVLKASANTLFASHDHEAALEKYDDALHTCPQYLHFPRAVLHSNIAACHIQQRQWPAAIKAASAALDALAKLEPKDPKDPKGSGDDQVDEEIISAGAAGAAPALTPQAAEADVLRIRTKALLRRARARSEAGGWQNLAGAEEDYRALAQMPGLTPADARTVRAQLRDLPPRTKAAQEAEMGEMWGKLRQLGDGILKPFGLSTNNFQMVKDENTGGYSMNFKQGGNDAESSG